MLADTMPVLSPRRWSRWKPEAAYNGCKVAEFLIARNGKGLNQELVATLGIQRRLLLHSLENNFWVSAIFCRTEVSQEWRIP